MAENHASPAKPARFNPGVRRVVAILNFFAEHPGQSFTFTDIVRALKLGRATCHSLLAGLVEAGYLYRNNDKSYLIGPALAALGRIANEHFSPLQAAQPEMRALADGFDAVCSAIFLDHGDAVVRGRAAATSHLGWTIPEGKRMPLRAPFGAVFFTWSTPAEVQAWLDQLLPPPTPEQRAKMLEGIAFTRQYGFSFGVRNFNVRSDPDAPELAFSGDKKEYPVSLMSECDPEKDYPLAFVTAPVLDDRGQVAFVLNLTGFTGLVGGARVELMARRLCEACKRITGFIAGKTREPARVAD